MLTSGMVGAEVEFLFSDEWAPLIKTAVFIAGSQKRVVLEAAWRDNICIIPHECLAESDVHLLVGVYGTNIGGSLVIPTVYADLGMIWTGADADGETGAEASPELWAQLQAQLDLKESSENKVTFLSEASTDEQYPSSKAVYEAIAAGGSVVIEGTVSDDMSEVTITTPDAWTLVSEAWNSEKRPLVVLRLSDDLCAYLTSVSTMTVDGQSQGVALFSLPPIRQLGSTPPYSIWLDESGGAAILPVESINGADGIGIQSVEQTTTSTEDGGINVITVTKTDGTSSMFTVRNGSKGSTGATGAAGEDGYTPVRGTDYWTADDIATIQSYIDEKATVFQTKSITDSGGHFTSDTVEGALQEIGTELAGINTLLGSGIQISFTIDGDPFSAVSGETWKEWIGGYSRVISEISGLTLYCFSDDGIIFADEAGVNALGLNDVWVHGNETIVSGATYAIIPCGG